MPINQSIPTKNLKSTNQEKSMLTRSFSFKNIKDNATKTLLIPSTWKYQPIKNKLPFKTYANPYGFSLPWSEIIHNHKCKTPISKKKWPGSDSKSKNSESIGNMDVNISKLIGTTSSWAVLNKWKSSTWERKLKSSRYLADEFSDSRQFGSRDIQAWRLVFPKN